MNTNGESERIERADGSQEMRLPQIDATTFSALSMLDGFVARAALTRQEHAEANKSLQHIAQTIETLQAEVREFQQQAARFLNEKLNGERTSSPTPDLVRNAPINVL